MRLMSLLAAILSNDDVKSLPQQGLGNSTISSALKLVFGIAGAISVLVVTIAGFKYVISQGNPQETAKAKDTILYALIGLAICILAFAIVTFVIDKI